ncbi:MAG: hypothetical protein U1E40_03825 [Amaricoccus sp.]
MLVTRKRRWFWVAAVAAAMAAGGFAAAERRAAPTLPGTCAKALVLFCADPSWPDAR